MSEVSCIVVGAGCRGTGYARIVAEHFPDVCRIAGVCEPNDDVRNAFAEEFGIPDDRRFRSWENLLGLPKLADMAFICTQDSLHRDSAVALANMGYHLMLEKPMATTSDKCLDVYEAAKRNGVMLAVCHVLRYTPFNRKLKQLIADGLIGAVHSIQLIEQVVFWHQAHSYVRGNWRNEETSSPMLLAKSCHDIDLLNYLIPSKCTKVSSFGTLSHFRPENRPQGASDRCTLCPSEIESKCPYSAIKIYLRDTRNLDSIEEALVNWPVNVVSPIGTPEAVWEALNSGPYGRCVYCCDNDVVDHQVVNLEFDDGATASFTMSAFTPHGGREIYIMGDRGSLRCYEEDVIHHPFLIDEEYNIEVGAGDSTIVGGHGGGDYGLVRDFLLAVRRNDPSYITSGPDVSLDSHLIVFAAEKSRRDSTVETICRDTQQSRTVIG